VETRKLGGGAFASASATGPAEEGVTARRRASMKDEKEAIARRPPGNLPVGSSLRSYIISPTQSKS